MVQQSMVKRTKEAKKNAAIAALAMKLAKDNNDALFKKSQKFKKLFLAAKQAVVRKYRNKARNMWMMAQNGVAEADKK